MADKIVKYNQINSLLSPVKTFADQEVAKRVSTEADQGLDDTQKLNARTNIAAAEVTPMTCTLPVDGWSSNVITVSCSGVTASNNLVISPDPASYVEYNECGIYCSAQASNTLTFTRASANTNALTVNVIKLA